MNAEQIKQLIESGIDGAQATVKGEEGKFEAIVISDSFEGFNMVKQHQLVYSTVNEYISSGELHALTIKAYTRAEWEAQESSD